MAADNQTVISKIQVPSGTVYDIKPSNNANININGVYYVEVAGTSSALTGTLDASLTTYYNGLKVIIYNTLNTDIAENATLNLNGLGAKSIKRYNTVGGNIHSKGSALLVYRDGKFYQDDYYSDIAYESDAHSPIAAMDIYASLEYPAIVCVNTKDYVEAAQTGGGNLSPIAQQFNLMAGTNLLYDAAYSIGFASGATKINPDWGFALLIHDVSLGQRVPEKYLLKRGKYTLHTDLTDTTLQGFYNGSINGNAIGSEMLNNSVYRWIDSIFYTQAHEYMVEHSELIEPTVYMFGYATFHGEPGANADGPFIMMPFSLGLTANNGASASHYCYAVAGKAIMGTDSSGYPSAIEIDFTDDTVYTYVGGGTDLDCSAKIIAVNGRNIATVSEVNPGIALDTALDNPVSGGGKNYIAGEDISPYAVVCLGLDGSIYNITTASQSVIDTMSLNMDWGLAVYKNTHIAVAGSRIPQGALLQQCTVPNSTSSSAISTYYVHYLGSGEGGTLKLNGVLSSVKPTSGTYMYAGILDGPNALMHYDFSNHDFISVDTEDGSTRIKRINGVDISGDDGGELETFTYDNPVAGDAQNPIAGVNIPANSFVVLGKNGSLYPITYSTPIDINMDWGVAYLTAAVQTKNRPIVGTLMQQCYAADASYSANIYTSYNNTSDAQHACYLHCSAHTNPDTVLSNSPELTATDIKTGLTYVVFVGYRDANNNLSIDFSNHDFFGFTNDGVFSSLNNHAISASSPSTSIDSLVVSPSANVAIGTSNTKITQLDLPTAGKWQVTAQLTLYNTNNASQQIHAFICSSTASTTNYTTTYIHTASITTVPKGYSNMYLQCISNGEANRHYYLVAIDINGSANTVSAIKTTSAAQESVGNGSYNATHLMALRIGDYEND